MAIGLAMPRQPQLLSHMLAAQSVVDRVRVNDEEAAPEVQYYLVAFSGHSLAGLWNEAGVQKKPERARIETDLTPRQLAARQLLAVQPLRVLPEWRPRFWNASQEEQRWGGRTHVLKHHGPELPLIPPEDNRTFSVSRWANEDVLNLVGEQDCEDSLQRNRPPVSS
jgi:hypothetical protein